MEYDSGAVVASIMVGSHPLRGDHRRIRVVVWSAMDHGEDRNVHPRDVHAEAGRAGFVIRRLAQESLDAAMFTQLDPDGTRWVDDPTTWWRSRPRITPGGELHRGRWELVGHRRRCSQERRGNPGGSHVVAGGSARAVLDAGIVVDEPGAG
ncbi:hypothetical protein I6I10_07110 [Corynebacterium glucuronolyticum]|uniref:Uncharacterized protein n=1 Tax=Corynebacterium glucuronolyticum TaxID=39791 RepID=A0A7T4ECJ9_9CORY|nr:hypothetical protein [Corynebacterium glucuronolyticum]QQB45308.1 hypothetical protein I6I10_07110 [Corynebacterium glucuronolyticum]